MYMVFFKKKIQYADTFKCLLLRVTLSPISRKYFNNFCQPCNSFPSESSLFGSFRCLFHCSRLWPCGKVVFRFRSHHLRLKKIFNICIIHVATTL
ncbi:hypothetical protein FKM82_000482 [Ascaphus truei]